MNKVKTFFLMWAVSLSGIIGFTSCSSADVEDNSQVVYDEQGKAGVKPEFVISIPRSVVGTTRQSNEVTQSSGSVDQFRGLDNIRLIPFSSEPTSSSTKLADIMRLSHINALNSPGAVNYKVYADQFVPVGTRNFLFYAKAIDIEAEQAITTMDEKFRYGVLHVSGLTNDEFRTPNDITVSLEQINTSAEAQTTNPIGRNIVQLLNSLANITVSGVAAPNDKWSTTTNVGLSHLYKNFLGTTVSSSKGVSFILSKLYFGMDRVRSNDPARPLADAICQKILEACRTAPVNDEPVDLISDYAGYPGNIGLPDGAVRVRWNAGGLNSNSFVDVTTNYRKNMRTEITDYVYPAALWYHVSTPLKAANSIKSSEYDMAGNWDGVINGVYSAAADEVFTTTQSVALNKAAEYGVGRLETRINMGDGVFYDGDGKEVNVGDGFTLKGILLGGQNSADFDFTSKGNENMTIYDRDMTSGSIIAVPNYTTATANQTLALETKSNQVVMAALELVNGGEDFKGFDGVIPSGATFYLTVRLDPATATNYVDGSLDKIIKKDHVTKLTVTIKNGSTTADRNGDGIPDVYIKDEDGTPIGVDDDGDGEVDPYDIDGDGNPDDFITDPAHGGPGWDTDGDGEVDIPVLPDPEDGDYPDGPNVPEGLGNAVSGIPDLTSPGVELGTSVNLEWQEGLNLTPTI
ncbi:MAG: hypothetical protein J6X07_03120 [Prevotella sp.]|nr:hypothetical protein [Prevotella sp.]